MSYTATIDVPGIEAGLDFYGGVLGFREVARPIPDDAPVTTATFPSKRWLMAVTLAQRPGGDANPVDDGATGGSSAPCDELPVGSVGKMFRGPG